MTGYKVLNVINIHYRLGEYKINLANQRTYSCGSICCPWLNTLQTNNPAKTRVQHN